MHAEVLQPVRGQPVGGISVGPIPPHSQVVLNLLHLIEFHHSLDANKVDLTDIRTSQDLDLLLEFLLRHILDCVFVILLNNSSTTNYLIRWVIDHSVLNKTIEVIILH